LLLPDSGPAAANKNRDRGIPGYGAFCINCANAKKFSESNQLTIPWWASVRSLELSQCGDKYNKDSENNEMRKMNESFPV